MASPMQLSAAQSDPRFHTPPPVKGIWDLGFRV